MTFKKEIRWLVAQMRPFLRAQVLSVLFTVLSSAMFLLDPLIIKWMIDGVFPRKDMRLLALGGISFFAIYVFRLAFSSIGGAINFNTAQKKVLRSRLKLVNHIHGSSPAVPQSLPVVERHH